MRAIEDQYQLCVQYLRKNRACSMQELSTGTGVSVKQITKFIREGRITNREATNVKMACEVCGDGIMEGTICDNCRMKLNNDINHLKQDALRKAELERKNTSTFQIKDRSDDKKRL
jgi:hypothetical protein